MPLFHVFLLSLLYALTRIPFLRPYPVYYDSFEYVRIIEKINWSSLHSFITTSHQPVHTLYFIICLIFKSLFPSLSTPLGMVLSSLFFGYGTCIIWYFVLRKIRNKKIALWGAIILLLFPYFFITNTNILYESELLFFQLAAFFILLIGNEKKKERYIFFSGIVLGLAHLVFIGTAYIVPIFLGFIWGGFSRKKWYGFVGLALFCIGYCLSGILLDFFILQSVPLLQVKYVKHVGDVVSQNQGLILMGGRMIRNVLVQVVAILSPGGAILLVFSALYLLIKKRVGILVIVALLFIPFFILMQYWHAGFFGRLAIGIIFPASFLIVLFFDSPIAHIAKIVVLLIFFISIPWRQLDPPPLYASFYQIQNDKNIAVITSDYHRFLYEEAHIPYFAIKGDTDPKEIQQYIDSALSQKVVLIDSAALRYPYYQYDGDTYHILSVRTDGTPLIKNILERYRFTEYNSVAYSDLFFLKIEKK